MYFGYPTVNTDQVIANASNIRTGENPAYSVSDFLSTYPQFGENSSNVAIVPETLIQAYIDLSNASIKKARWHNSWIIAMGLFTAHWCSLWLRSTASQNSGKDAVIQASVVQGIITTESVGGVSYSMDINTALQDLSGYAAWKSTEYGVQLATLGKIYGKGMMCVW